MAKTFMAWYSVGEYGKLWFTAEDEEQAEALLKKVSNGEMSPDDLPDYDSSVKGGDPWEFEGLVELR